MVSSTTAMGGVVAWATGGDFLQGAMQGMNIGFLNHAMHDDPPSVSTQQEDQNLQNMLPEVVVIGKAPAYVVKFANPIFAQRVSLYSISVIFPFNKDTFPASKLSLFIINISTFALL